MNDLDIGLQVMGHSLPHSPSRQPTPDLPSHAIAAAQGICGQKSTPAPVALTHGTLIDVRDGAAWPDLNPHGD